MSGIGGAFRLRPSHTTVRTGPYTAVREVRLTTATSTEFALSNLGLSVRHKAERALPG
jgi:hypothetical protein